ncbi:MAG TPA: prepilin-type N-terminal cleavage/methylation domain-containing protein [Firmicutes bacterium]|nr:prepilin-type N-terminal cleavage/methylation domain-containing protein [Bacillota bacterium]
MEIGSTPGVRKPHRDRGFTLVEVLVVLTIVPLVLGIAFSAVSVALRSYRLVEARADLCSAGTLVMETLGQDIRGVRRIYEDSSEARFHGLVQDNMTDVSYEFVPSEGSLPGTLRRNGKDLFGPDTSVTSCEFTYLAPGPDPDAPLEEVAPQNASSVKVRLTIANKSTSMTYESIFDARNL